MNAGPVVITPEHIEAWEAVRKHRNVPAAKAALGHSRNHMERLLREYRVMHGLWERALPWTADLPDMVWAAWAEHGTQEAGAKALGIPINKFGRWVRVYRQLNGLSSSARPPNLDPERLAADRVLSKMLHDLERFEAAGDLVRARAKREEMHRIERRVYG
jgi:hypothetical protein